MTRIPRHGMVLIYAIVSLVAIMGVMSLAIDYGRAQCAKTELQNAVDSAARYAITGLGNNSASAYAIAAAAENNVNGTSLTLQSGDIETGTWDPDTNTFTPGDTPADAVRITGKLTKSRGNAVKLLFASVVGMDSIEMTSTSVMIAESGTIDSYGFVGLDSVNMSGGSCTVDSYLATVGYSAGTSSDSAMSSNCNVNVNGSVTLHGDINYGPCGNYSSNSPAVISGSRNKMQSNLCYSNVSLGKIATKNNNKKISGSGYSWDGTNLIVNSGGTVNFANGNYYVPNLVVNSGGTLNYTATGNKYTNLYVGNITFSGTMKHGGSTTSILPKNLRVRFYTAGGLNINNASFYGTIHGPLTALNINNGSLFGQGVFKSISGSTASFHYDSSITSTPYPASGGGAAVSTNNITRVQ